ncbi:site-specific integrase, partial [Salmonella enterica]|nr:site-specific integrase [Salmonella enterica]
MTLKYKIKRLKNKDGIRSCIIINESNGLPLVYSNLYMSVISRTNSYSFSTMEAIANALLLFERYNAYMNVGVFDMVNPDIEKLVSNKGYLFGLMNALSYRNDLENVTSILKEQHVSKRTLYFKIMTIENYVKWFFDNIAINNIDSSRYEAISRAFDFIKPRIENGKNYNIESESKSLTNEQVTTLTDMVSVKSKINPFSEHVRFRNNLIIKILLETGIRGGELLNIKLVDFDYVHKSLCIVRRPDDQNEPRLRQPLVKTLERKIPLSIELTELIQNYISDFRGKQCHAGEHDYLLVTHSSKGQLGH